VQTYSDGEVVAWDQPTPEGGAEPERPAPAFAITPSDETNEDGAAADDEAAAATPTSSSDDDSEDGGAALWLAAAALIVGAGGVLVGALGWRRAGKQP
jgi:hypothetical protein